MALPAQDQLKYWSIAALLFFVVLYLLGNVLTPFILGSAVAYLLDPVADRLQKWGLSRIASVAVISISFVVIGIAFALLIIPALIRQIVGLVEIIPDLLMTTRQFASTHLPAMTPENSIITQSLASVAESLKDKTTVLIEGLLSTVRGVAGLFILFFIVPVVAIYMLIDWDRMIARVDDLLPRDHAPVIRQLAREIDQTLSSFLRGQGLVCLIQGTFYAVALMLAGLNFGLIVGVIAGLISFIPYVGALVGGALAIGLAVFQFWGDPLMIALIAGIFFFGQVVEGNVLTPNLVGSSVGLHPVWLLLALSIFGALFGFVGLLVAVPVSAMMGVVIRFLVTQYKDGRLYRGQEHGSVVPRRTDSSTR